MKTFNEKVSKYFTIVLITLAVGTLLAWLPFSFRRGIDAFTAVLIVACPCALALSTPFTMSAALSIFDRNLFYLKNTTVVEQMARIDTLVMDKTGTITTGSSKRIDLGGELTGKQRQLIYSACANSIHPLSRMICQYFGDLEKLTVSNYQEIAGKGITATSCGHELRIGSGDLVFGYSTEAKLMTRVHLMIDGLYLGYFGFYHEYREGMKQIAELAPAYSLYLLSGDRDHERPELIRYFHDEGHLYFEQSPQQKLDHIEILQRRGLKVMMLGDGLNDSGALKQSDLGVAVTDNVNNFSPGSDAILDGRAFHKLPAFLRFSKDTVTIIHLSFMISLAYNLIGLSYAVTGRLSPLVAAVLMPLSTVTIISFTTLATHFTAKRRKLI